MEKKKHQGRSGWRFSSSLVYIPMIYLLIGTLYVLLLHKVLPLCYVAVSPLVHMLLDFFFVFLTGGCLLFFIRSDRSKTKAIEEKEARLRTLIDAVPDYIFFKDRKGQIVEMNQVAQSLFFANDPSRQLSNFENTFTWCAQLDEYIWRIGEPMRKEEALTFPDGSVKHFDVIKTPVLQADGLGSGTLVIGRDITDRIKAEEELKAIKEQLESFLNQTPDGVGMLDVEGKVVRMNKAFERLFGWSVEEIIGKALPTVPDHLIAEFEAQHREVLEGGHVLGFETKRKRKDGTMLDISMSLLPVRDGSGAIVGFAGILRDITEQKRVERLLRESEAKYRFIAENMTDLIRIFGRNGENIYISPSHEQLLGYSLDSFQQERDQLRIHPEDRDQLIAGFREIIRSKALKTVEFRYRHKRGDWLTLEARIMPYVANGELDRFVIVARDITERRRAEELLRQSDKLSVIGQLAAGIAHEIRNPLTALRGFIQLLQNSSQAEQKYCEIMLSELDRINFIASELLLLAKPQVVKYQPKDLRSLLQNVISLLDSQAIMSNIQIKTHYPPDVPSIICEENQLKQVFINILKNAIEAMPGGGTILIEIETAEEGMVLIRFVDQGCGIEQDRIPKLGEPFYTTKEKGTGLGLMVSFKIIEDHGGSIMIESEQHVGTTVQVLLPGNSGNEQTVNPVHE